MQNRFYNLDALRGYAIFTMILSGSIAYGPSLPAWMFHAQVPPPSHQFNPSLPGITWVDLVFPFFIFCMGAAMPIAMQKFVVSNSYKNVVITSFRRFGLLVFFALFLEHFKSPNINAQPTSTTYFLTLIGYLLMFFSFSKLTSFVDKKIETIINLSAMVIGVGCLIWLPLNNGVGFQIGKSDIIIIVLANMALFGTIIWWITRNNPLLRIGILPFIMAIFLGSKIPESWNALLYNLTPESAVYKFYFLKYLFILIPGTIAGDWLLKYKDVNSEDFKNNNSFKLFAGILLSVVLCNVLFLFSRQLVLNLFITIGLLIVAKFVFNKMILSNKKIVEQFFYAGVFALLLGLSFEAFEGGIKKDFSTYSYYLVTVGLAFFSLIVLAALQTLPIGKNIHRFFVLTGQNPMMAYVSGSLLLMPIMHLTDINTYWDAMNSNSMLGFLKGFSFTMIVCLITIPFTKKGMIWKS